MAKLRQAKTLTALRMILLAAEEAQTNGSLAEVPARAELFGKHQYVDQEEIKALMGCTLAEIVALIVEDK